MTTQVLEMKEEPTKVELIEENESSWTSKRKLEPIVISKDTRDILELLKKELKEIYGEDLSSDDDVILYLYSYYCRK